LGTEELNRLLTRWTGAGLLDDAGAARIRAFEAERVGRSHLRWPMRLVIGLGALLLGAGVLLFVSAHWDGLAPSQRFALVLALVAVFHAAAAAVADRSPTLSEGLHAVGTISLGAGIFLSGQIFNMAEHWPAGVMLWAAGAWLAWLMLRHETQLFLAALLTPAWLASEWLVILGRMQRYVWDNEPLLPAALLLLALTYCTKRRTPTAGRDVLVWLGGIALVPTMLLLALTTSGPIRMVEASTTLTITAWSIGLGVPLALTLLWRGSAAWMNGTATAWVVVLLWFSTFREELLLHGWWAAGALGLVMWGAAERRTERINLGAAVFAVTVVFFYFSNVMDKLGRSASLIGFGLLFLAGGWALERTRRQLVRTAKVGE
jgi:uncharacterized membrane protein